MKKIIGLFFIFTVLFIGACGGGGTDEDKVKDTADKLIELAKQLDMNKSIEANGDILREAGTHLAYTGSDKSRRWKTTLNFDNPDEREMIADIMENIYDDFSQVSNYSFGKMEKETESEGTWHIIPITIDSAPVYFAFLKVDDKFILGDID